MESPSPAISFWAVAFLDLLGYREVLDGMDRFPLEDSGPEYKQVLASFATAIRLRRRLLGGINEFLTGQTSGAAGRELLMLPSHLRSTADAWSRAKIFRMPGPDHIVLGCSLAKERDHFPMRGVCTLMLGAATAMLMQLWIGAEDAADTRPLRGGIDVAPGCLLEPEQFLYSPAVTRAYLLESTEAKYPRILIGQRFVDAIRAHADDRGTPEARYNADLACRAESMMFRDLDGRMALDYFGAGVREGHEPLFAQQIAGDAWRYVKLAQARARQGGVDSIIAKYDWLAAYLRRRLSAWGIDADAV